MITTHTDGTMQEQQVYQDHLGKPGFYGTGDSTAPGILREIDLKNGYMIIQPSVVQLLKAYARIETERPTVIRFSPGATLTLRPLQEGDLEAIITEINRPNPPQNQDKTIVIAQR